LCGSYKGDGVGGDTGVTAIGKERFAYLLNDEFWNRSVVRVFESEVVEFAVGEDDFSKLDPHWGGVDY